MTVDFTVITLYPQIHLTASSFQNFSEEHPLGPPSNGTVLCTITHTITCYTKRLNYLPLIREYIPAFPRLLCAFLPGGSYHLPPSIPLHLILIPLGQNPQRNPASAYDKVRRFSGVSLNDIAGTWNIINWLKAIF